MFFRCPELDGLTDQLSQTYLRKASALTIEENSLIERELACLRSDIETHQLFCKICTRIEKPNSSAQVRRMAENEIERQLFVGQQVIVKTLNETYIVISIDEDGSSVELLSANGAPSMLRKVRVSDLSPAQAKPDKGKKC